MKIYLNTFINCDETIKVESIKDVINEEEVVDDTLSRVENSITKIA